jgi:hypothetical protein
MLCALVFVSMGHTWVQGVGSVMVRTCYYSCNHEPLNGSWYNRVYSVSPYYSCPVSIGET